MFSGRITSRAAIALAVLLTAAGVSTAESVRPAYCAGTWYPGTAEELSAGVSRLLAEAPAPPVQGRPIALIAPHAGYRFSAPIAATAYKALEGHDYNRMIVLAFSHRNAGAYSGVDVPAETTAYRTPLGDVPLDRDVCDALLRSDVFNSHPRVGVGEHSLELQLPFLQRTVGDFKLVPLLVGRMDDASYASAAAALLPYVNDQTLLVVSTDFTHFGPNYGYRPFSSDVPEQLRKLAAQAAAPLLRADYDGFKQHFESTGDTICGRGPVLLLLRTLSMMGGAQAVRSGVDYSGAMTDDWSNSVTYQAFVFTHRPGTLSQAVRTEALDLARKTVTAYLTGERPPKLNPDAVSEDMRSDGACFVTLQNHGQLRGCIGNMEAVGPLYKSVMHNAVASCRDHRFVGNPVTAAELLDIEIEVSYLTPMRAIEKPEEIIVGRHGLHITKGTRRGVLLPQVAYERGWTRQEFLQQVCRKAGLPPDAWKSGAVLQTFEAEVFSEASEGKHECK